MKPCTEDLLAHVHVCTHARVCVVYACCVGGVCVFVCAYVRAYVGCMCVSARRVSAGGCLVPLPFSTFVPDSRVAVEAPPCLSQPASNIAPVVLTPCVHPLVESPPTLYLRWSVRQAVTPKARSQMTLVSTELSLGSRALGEAGCPVVRTLKPLSGDTRVADILAATSFSPINPVKTTQFLPGP